MRKATLPMLVFVVCSYATNAQFTLTPRAGIENSAGTGYRFSGAKINLGEYASPQAGIRLDYRFKNTHGPFIGLSSSRLTEWQWRVEAGYAYNSPAIKLGRGTALRIQPFAGAALTPNRQLIYSASRAEEAGFDPGAPEKLEYETRRFSRALLGGTSFEFSKGNCRKITVGVQYLRSASTTLDLRNLPVMFEGPKFDNYVYKYAFNSWNVYVGVPIVLKKNKKPVETKKPEAPKRQCYRVCGGKY